MNLRSRIAQTLIETWSQNPELSVGVPFRGMATEAADVVMKILAEEEIAKVESLANSCTAENL